MTIVTTILNRIVIGSRVMVMGKSVLSGTVATGDVITGLSTVEAFYVTVNAAAQQGSCINETFPLAASTAVTVIVETNDSTFYWTAIGKD